MPEGNHGHMNTLNNLEAQKCLCLFGQPRYTDETLQSLYNNIIEPLGINFVFCHFWKLPKQSKFNSNIDDGHGTYNGQEIGVYNMLDPVTFKSEYCFFDPSIDNMYPMWYSVQQSIKLKQEFENIHEFKFSDVIVTRLDLLYIKKYRFSKKESTIFLKRRPVTNDSYNDWFFHTDSSTSDKLGLTYDSLDEKMFSEQNLFHHLRNNNINVEYLPNFFTIQRSNGTTVI